MTDNLPTYLFAHCLDRLIDFLLATMAVNYLIPDQTAVWPPNTPQMVHGTHLTAAAAAPCTLARGGEVWCVVCSVLWCGMVCCAVLCCGVV